MTLPLVISNKTGCGMGAGTGTLDECNGRFGVTPEFPQGIYHYYTTETYPFVQRCVRGNARVGR